MKTCPNYYYFSDLQVIPQLFQTTSVWFLLLNNSAEVDDIMAASILCKKNPPISTSELCDPTLRLASLSQSQPGLEVEPVERQHLIGEFGQDAFLFFHILRLEPQCSTGLMSYSEYS